MSATPLAYEYGTLLVVIAVVVWIATWIMGARDIFRRDDLTTSAKAAWMIIIILLPLIGLFIYFTFASRPRAA